MISPLKEEGAFTCTFNTTEECNLRCKYCYELNKSPKVLDLNNAKLFIDHIFSDPDPADLLSDPDPIFKFAYAKGLIFDFIGGDSLMNIPILEGISNYTLKNLWTLDGPNIPNWRENFKMSLSTNGTLFGRPEVKDWCLNYKNILGLGVSIDGCPKIHDMNRIFKGGQGSMGEILKYWDWYKVNFPNCACQTKATSSRNSIPFLYESLKFMHEDLGINYINQNFIMEDMHIRPEDLTLLDQQLEKCIPYILDHQKDLHWSLIGKNVAEARKSTKEEWDGTGWCGSGAMPALSVNGNIYPCIRWLPHTQVDKNDFIVGTAKEGFTHKENFKKVREGAYRSNCSKDPKCKDCEIESACAYCIGGCYSEFGEFKRTTYSCEVNKHLVKWARVYWNEYNRQNNIPTRYDENVLGV